MNIFDLMPNWKGDSLAGDLAEELEGPRGQKTTGPFTVRHITNGQYRRMIERRAKAQKRKANKRFRRTWMDNRQATAVLRGQLAFVRKGARQELVATEGPDGVMSAKPGVVYIPQVQHVVRDLEAKYGSVETAEKHYAEILAEQVA